MANKEKARRCLIFGDMKGEAESMAEAVQDQVISSNA
jgi:hypothetical protein